MRGARGGLNPQSPDKSNTAYQLANKLMLGLILVGNELFRTSNSLSSFR